ncbi:MAG: type 1 glutamine amidotransferase [Gammaproteobacteria bacterium]|nr:type 1 glutamine amidotransferase [Gammaproteobacteria bacterium]
MKPILILQHIDSGGPGLFAEFLDARGIEYVIRRPDLGDAIPVAAKLNDFVGFCLCGGTQSANDPLPWIAAELEMIRAAGRYGLPVIGHCLGGQLISKACGGEVRRSARPEFGWQRLYPVEGAGADEWLADAPPEPIAMQWHEEVYSDPPGAAPLLTGDHCRNQAFVLDNMLGMQFHVEVTDAAIRQWATELADHLPPPGPGVQSAAEALAQLPFHFPASRALAWSLYSRWLAGA